MINVCTVAPPLALLCDSQWWLPYRLFRRGGVSHKLVSGVCSCQGFIYTINLGGKFILFMGLQLVGGRDIQEESNQLECMYPDCFSRGRWNLLIGSVNRC